jgi:hypothetical protein
MYENVNDPEMRDRLRLSFGYCHEHSWLLGRSKGEALGIAIVNRDMLTHAAAGLRETRFQSPGLMRRAGDVFDRARPAAGTEAAVRRLSPQAPCPACLHRSEMEDIAVGAALDALVNKDQRLQSALEASAGLCLPHMRRALELTRDESVYDYLSRLGQQKLDALVAELEEFIRKNDYRFAREGFGPEGDSWRRAIAMLVGAADST